MEQAMSRYNTTLIADRRTIEKRVFQTPIDYREANAMADRAIESVSDLIDDPKYKPFFYKRLYTVGPTRFIDLADQARKQGLKKGRMFVKLLKEAV